MDIPGVGPSISMGLQNIGIKTVDDLIGKIRNNSTTCPMLMPDARKTIVCFMSIVVRFITPIRMKRS